MRRQFGRSAEVPLSTRGRAQAVALADRLACLSVASVHASPLDRTMETARCIADRSRLPVEPCADLLEVDYGDWSGATLDELHADEQWTNDGSGQGPSRERQMRPEMERNPSEDKQRQNEDRRVQTSDTDRNAEQLEATAAAEQQPDD